MIKVSIIVPIYKTEKYLKRCIDSLLNQTESNIEVLLINDGSPDNSDEIVKTYEDSRIVYIEKKNEGIGKTRNLGIKKARGEYLMFIDSDDYIAPECVEKMYERAKKDDLDLLISDFYKDIDGTFKEVRVASFPNCNIKDDPSIITELNLGPCNKIYRRTIFADKNIRFEEKLKYEDSPFILKAIMASKKIGKIDECLSYYVIHSGSETTTRDEKIFDILSISQIIIDELSKYDYMKDALTDVMVATLTDYVIQQRYIKDKKKRSEFLDAAFHMLDNLDPEWRKCSCLKKFSFPKRLIKSHKTLIRLYYVLYDLKIKKEKN